MTDVPSRYRGVWRRLSLRDTDGSVDTRTQVHWLQTGSLYCDLRVPAERPDASAARSLDDLDDRALGRLAEQQGFAGVLEVVGDICRWRREIDYQPATGSEDAGRTWFDEGVLVEEGVHADYTEHWQCLEGGTGETLSLTLAGEDDASGGQRARRGYLLVSGNYFMFALARTCALPPAPSLAQLIADGDGRRDEVLRFLDFEISFGRRRGAAVPWRIDLSTLPFREGLALLTPEHVPRHRGGARWEQPLDGTRGVYSRHWLSHEGRSDFRWFD